MTPIPLYDILEVLPSDEFSFIQTGVEVPDDGKLNLCERAFWLVKEKYNIGNVMIHLRKQIPVGAGLGGGSSDAAFVLKALNKIFELSITSIELEEMAAKLGSDCAFFIDSTPKLATGRGEKLASLSHQLAGYRLVLLNPKIHVSTSFAYAQIIPKIQHGDWLTAWKLPIVQWQDTFINDFEAPIAKHFPIIAHMISALKDQGALYAAMSGSGSSVFGIFSPNKEIDLSKFDEFIVLDSLID